MRVIPGGTQSNLDAGCTLGLAHVKRARCRNRGDRALDVLAQNQARDRPSRSGTAPFRCLRAVAGYVGRRSASAVVRY